MTKLTRNIECRLQSLFMERYMYIVYLDVKCEQCKTKIVHVDSHAKPSIVLHPLKNTRYLGKLETCLGVLIKYQRDV